MIRILIALLALSVTALAQVNQAHLRGTTSNVQTQLNAKLPLSGGTITGSLYVTNAPYAWLVATNLWMEASSSFKLYTPGIYAGTVSSGYVLRLSDDSDGSAEYVPLQVDNVALLKSLPTNSVPDGWIIKTVGYYTDGDGGEGLYRYQANSASTANDGTVIAPTYLPGRFHLLGVPFVNVRQFGAKGDNTTDDTTRIQAAITECGRGNKALYFPAGRYLISSTLNFDGSFAVYGDGPGPGVDTSYSGSASVIRYTGTGTAIQINSGTSRITQQFSLRNLSVLGYASNGTTRTGATGITVGVATGTLLSAQGLLENVWASGFVTNAFNFVSAQGVNVVSCRASDNEVGFEFDNQTGGANRNVTFTRCQATSNNVGLMVEEGGALQFVSCQFESNSREGVWISRKAATGIYSAGQLSFLDCHVEANQASPANDGETYAAQFRIDSTLTTGADGFTAVVRGGRWVPNATEAASFSKLNRLFKVSASRLYCQFIRPTTFTYALGAVVAEAVGPTTTALEFVCDYNPWIGSTPASQYPFTGGTVTQITVVGSSSISVYYYNVITGSSWRATSSSWYAKTINGAVNDFFGDTRVRDGSLYVGPTTSYPVASAIAAFRSTTQGVGIPQMTTAQKNAIASPAAGLIVYDTTLGKMCVYTTAWETITSVP